MPSPLETLKSRLADVNALRSATAMMDWDQQTYMPRGGAEARAEHLGILSRMAHETFVADETRRALDDAQGSAEGDDAAMIRVTRRDIDLATKLPTKLVEEKSKLAAIAHERWVEARAKSDFAGFAPTLERMFDIVREEAEHLGYTDHIYDALIDQYEEGATAAEVRAMFESIKGPQVALVKKIKEQPQVDDAFLYGNWDEGAQSKFTEHLAKAVGFDFERGRQDTAPHPFCTGWSVGDIRLTTRYKPYLGSAIFGTLHEAGHGMYEQGSPMAWDRTPLAGGVSLGLHESQSRLWENIVGRSRAFWERFLPGLKESFPAIGDVDLDTFYRAINKVEPSYIRVEADELTYNLHVLVRFELECDVLTGKLAVKDLPDAWNAKYEEYLGITPRNDAEGCLQDVHWSMGSIGYFPTYSMGNLLSYQIWTALQRDLGDTDALISSGDFASILTWLQDHVYSKGRKYSPKDLVRQVTGEAISSRSYLDGLERKYVEIYRL
ncbi:carboxypeptidase M32 [Fimbriimonas ginsengisoli]|uniref:Metal-dependent carboxypeptidase n=1 Tax=Fimbriimonas ginsengisoli Gsoil 348 TaxID=661478 RepID=A0A068NVL6_FIMGI|nr:carboxypeptidase M32 [Fimbriimonas ginsengisoli]AIE87491.1 carboxypeptidase Taq [Fimbriimonas ginsengisoli Gsoil 348]